MPGPPPTTPLLLLLLTSACAPVDVHPIARGFFDGANEAGTDGAVSIDLAAQDLGAGGEVLWARRLGGPGAETAGGIAVGSDGTLLLTGGFEQDVDFGQGVLSSAGASDLFVAKLDSDGTTRWARRFGAATSDAGRGIAGAAAGGAVVTGIFSGQVDFDGTPLEATDSDALVLGLDAAGALTFARGFGQAFTDSGEQVAVAPSGAIVAVGAVHLGSDIWVQTLDASGTPGWSKEIASTGGTLADDRASAVLVDEGGGALIGGFFQFSVDFDGTPLSSAGGADAFAAAFSASGQLRWVKRYGGSGFDQVHGLARGPAGRLYAVGSFTGDAIFDSVTLSATNGYDAFVAEISSVDGSVLWARAYSGEGYEGAHALVAGADGRLFVVGTFTETISIGQEMMTSAGNSDFFVTCLDAQGGPLWARRYGGAGNELTPEITLDDAGRLIITGYFEGQANFGEHALQSAGRSDIFVLAISP